MSIRILMHLRDATCRESANRSNGRRVSCRPSTKRRSATTRVVEQTGILDRKETEDDPRG
jgi:hypothetical protein